MKRSSGSVGPWAREKLESLAQYLEFYTKVLKKQGHWLKGTIFVDAFAGSGTSRIRTSKRADEEFDLFPSDPGAEEFIKGSPRVALDIANPFTRYVFIERDAERITELHALAKEYSGVRNIDVREGEANSILRDWLASGIDWKCHRAVVFLDPFGMQVPWSTIEALAQSKAVEVLINFPLGMGIQRLLKKSGEIHPGWQMSLDTFFGSPDWRGLVYEEDTDLLGPTRRKVGRSGEKLLEWYRSRLNKAFGNVSSARLIRNTRGNPLYFLIWAGPHKKGLDGAEYILSKGERLTR